jgi:hypothetical protein
MSKEQESNNLHLLYFINSIQSVKNERKRSANDAFQVANKDYKKKKDDRISEDEVCNLVRMNNPDDGKIENKLNALDDKNDFNDGIQIMSEDNNKKRTDTDDRKKEELDIIGDNLDIEIFLKRFVNAIIKPEMIEKLLNESI